MTKVTQNEQGGYSYNKWCVYFFAELLKMAVAGAWSLHLKRTDPKAAAMMTFECGWGPSVCVFILPSNPHVIRTSIA